MTGSPTLRLPKLDERLQLIADLVPAGCNTAADIGADHGRLSCYLLFHGICRQMIVSDISSESLKKSKRLLEQHGLSVQAVFRVADGLTAIQEKVDAVLIAGIGGKTVSGMLQNHNLIGDARLIISVQTDLPFLRKALVKHQYTLNRETVVRAADRFYTVIEADKGNCDYSNQQIYIGNNLRDTDGATLIDYLTWKKELLSVARDPNKILYLKWLDEELACAKNSNK